MTRTNLVQAQKFREALEKQAGTHLRRKSPRLFV
jgi:hypothetical protein